MKRFIAVVFVLPALLILAMSSSALAQSPSDVQLMVVANDLYTSGQYSEATDFYEQLSRQGVHNWALYYNQGNAHYNQGDIGPAILSYLRAQRITPRNGALQSNLALARSQVSDSSASDGETPLAIWNDITERWLTLDELALVTLAIWFAFSMMLVVMVIIMPNRLKRLVKILAIVVAIPMVAAFVALGSRLYADAVNPDVVVVADEVEVMTGPNNQYALQLTMIGGDEARLLDARGSWSKVSLHGGKLEGWVLSDSIETVKSREANVLPLSGCLGSFQADSCWE